MSKEEYLTLRNNNQVYLITYEFYKEHFDESKHKPFLSIEEFIQSIQQWQFFNGLNVGELVQTCISFYDAQFNIFKVVTKEKTIYS